jgi:hypothetical protein
MMGFYNNHKIQIISLPDKVLSVSQERLYYMELIRFIFDFIAVYIFQRYHVSVLSMGLLVLFKRCS